MAATKICTIEGCDNPLSERSQLETCQLCRSGIGRWLKRRPAEVLERRRKLHLYDARMAEIVSEKTRRSKR